MALLFPVLTCGRLDGDYIAPWALIFAPVWLFNLCYVAGLVVSIRYLRSATTPSWSSDDETGADRDEEGGFSLEEERRRLKSSRGAFAALLRWALLFVFQVRPPVFLLASSFTFLDQVLGYIL